MDKTERHAKSVSVPGCKDCKSHLCLFRYHCDQTMLAELDSHKSILTLNKGEYLFKEGDDVACIYVIYSGNVKILRKWDQNKQYIVHLVREGDFLGIRGINSRNIHPVTTQTMTDTVLCYFPISFFRKAIWANHNVNQQFFEYLAKTLNKDEERMGKFAYLSVKGHIAEALAGQNRLYPHTRGAFFPISRRDLAAFAGTSYETVIRVLKEMEEEHLIETKGKQVRVLAPETLKRLIGK